MRELTFYNAQFEANLFYLARLQIRQSSALAQHSAGSEGCIARLQTADVSTRSHHLPLREVRQLVVAIAHVSAEVQLLVDDLSAQ